MKFSFNPIVIKDKNARKDLWQACLNADRKAAFSLQEAAQVLAWHQLWRKGQALVPMLPPAVITAALEVVVNALRNSDDVCCCAARSEAWAILNDKCEVGGDEF